MGFCFVYLRGCGWGGGFFIGWLGLGWGWGQVRVGGGWLGEAFILHGLEEGGIGGVAKVAGELGGEVVGVGIRGLGGGAVGVLEGDQGFADELALEAEAGGEGFVDWGVGVVGFGAIGGLVEVGVEVFVAGGDDGGDADALGGVAAGALEEAELADEVDFTGEDGGAVEGPDVVEDADGGLEPFGFGAAEFIDFQAEVGAFRVVRALEEFLEGLGFGCHLGLKVLGGGDDFAGVILDGLPAGGGAIDLAGDLFDVFDLLEATLDAVEFIHAGGDAVFEDEGDDGEAGADGEAGGEDPAFPGVEAGGGAEGPAAALSVAEQGDGHEDRIAEEEGPFCDPGWFGLEELGHDRVSSSGLVFSKRWKKGWGRMQLLPNRICRVGRHPLRCSACR
ncbi:MAG: hypothetical protein RI897_2337 [Verrucomicrobiota bacterium]